MSNYDYQQVAPSAGQSETSTLAVVSLVSGILGWSLLPIIGGIVAVVTGHKARKEIRASCGALGGDAMATVGLVLGYASFVLIVIPACVIAILLLLTLVGPSIGNVFSNIVSNI
ncbi:MAG: DUF4190 domain-containing protein [Anaerolineales bacterium]|nr:MAG: DUF4190 domain-containing protein [Anaerolineales bacterium]